MVVMAVPLQQCFQLLMQAVEVAVLLATVAQTKLVYPQMEELAEVMEDDAVLQIVQMLETLRPLDQEMLELRT
jgi:hypothetical protein